MLQRVFLGWDEPFLKRAVAWLLDHREDLPGMLVLTPTAQSGRRLREMLAESSGAVLAPRIATPGSLMRTEQPDIAPDWQERLAWVEVLENVRDWSPYEALFSEAPEAGQEWAGSLAEEMTTLRHALQENGLLLSGAARTLSESVEAERWDALARLESLVERKLTEWNLKSRSRVLEKGLVLPGGISQIVLAGVPELPPLVARALMNWNRNVTSLIGAPQELNELFDDLGLPSDQWTDRPLPWPAVIVSTDPRQQATEAVRIVSQRGIPSEELALGSADTETGDELARAFTRQGWIAFHPATNVPPGSLVRWFRTWGKWLHDPTLTVFQDLLTFPETGRIIHKREQTARRLAELRDRWMVIRTDDLRRRVHEAKFHNDLDKNAAQEVLEAALALEEWRTHCLSGDFIRNLGNLITKLSTSEAADEMHAWLSAAGPMVDRLDRSPRFWIELMVSNLSSPTPLPPPGRVIDVQGWLEIFHEPGQHLILCGMNEGKVPARSGGEPWLSEPIRKAFGLTSDSARAARDAYLFCSMVEARRITGSVHALCGKTGMGGETLLPSRLLLAAGRKDLPERVKLLFREIEPPEAGLRWEADWHWQPKLLAAPPRLNVTSLGDYLSCPFRYYLKHVLKMRQTEASRNEWNPRDFGVITHEVLERWALDTEAREYEKFDALHGWLSAELDRVVKAWFGRRPPLAVKIQTEALRQRLVWFARLQGVEKASGWDIVEVERKVEIPVGDAMIVAKIDRIDRNRHDGEYRVLDYKTGKVDGVDRAHRRRITAKSTKPEHLPVDSPAYYMGEEKGKAVEFQWSNLQLPLYASAWMSEKNEIPVPCYWTLGATEAGVAIHRWENFSALDMESARYCAVWIAEKISAGVFSPPAEKVHFDDYRVLSAGRDLREMVGPFNTSV